MRCNQRAFLSSALALAGLALGCSTEIPGGGGPDGGVVDGGPGGSGLDGAALYVSKGCVNCHGPLATSQKRNATFQRIRAAAGPDSQIAPMRNIALTDDEIRALVTALSDGPMSGSDRRRPLVKPLLLTRVEVGSRLYSIFRGTGGVEVEDEGIQEIIEQYIQSQAAFFGGHCNRYDGCETTEISASQNPGTSTVRAGILVRTCLEILTIYNTDRAVLAKAQLTLDDRVDATTVRAVWDVFAPGRPLSEASANLVVQAANENSGQPWSTVLQLFCRPTVLEAI